MKAGDTPCDGLPTPRRYWAAGTVLAAISLSVLDSTIANVSLPTISIDLNASPAQAVWVVNAYNLAMVTLLLPLAALAERIGARRVFSCGLILFILASLACAASLTLWQLTVARVFQGMGAATLLCLLGGLVRNIYPLKLLGRGISLNTTTVALMSVLGPTLGSAILSIASWPWIFAVNVPIGLIAMFGLRHLPYVPRNESPFDWRSALLSMVTLGLFIAGVDDLGRDVLRGLSMMVFAALIGWGLVRRLKKLPAPLVPLDLLRIRPVAYAVAALALGFAAQMAAYVALPFYFQHVLRRPPLEVGILMAAWPVGTAIIAPVAGRLSDRYAAATLIRIGAIGMVIGLVGLALLSVSTSNPWIMTSMFIVGVSFGIFVTPNNRAMLSLAPRQRSAAAGGLQATTRAFGQSLGTALVAIAFNVINDHGAVLALVLAAVCAAIAMMVYPLRLHRRGPPAV
jgi:DHA2 family multidrug resistance protein-like MFS transporter